MKGNVKNYPNNELKKLDGENYTGLTVDNLMQLADLGTVRTDAELEQRIDTYFEFCAKRNFRPGIESLCLALGTSRQNFWNWCNNINTQTKSPEWVETCRRARQLIISFLEVASINGKLNPATSIFLMKNWANYSDTTKYEVSTEQEKPTLSLNDIPLFSEMIDEE